MNKIIFSIICLLSSLATYALHFDQGLIGENSNSLSQSTCQDVYETNNSCATATPVFPNTLGSINANTSLDANIGYLGDQDWYELQISSCGTLTISLTNLPFNYDLELYGANCLGQWIDGSYNSNTNDEQIVFTKNSWSSTTIYVKVYSNNFTNFTTSSCYHIGFQWVSSISTPDSINGNKNICANSLNIYSINAIPNATSYTWILPSGWSGHSTTNSISATAGSMGGTISVVANSNCVNSTPQSIAVNVSPICGAATISGSNLQCQGSTTSFSANATGADAFNWMVPSGWMINSGQGTSTINVTVDSSSGDVCVTPSNSCNTGTAACHSVTVSQSPGAASISGSTSQCQGDSANYIVSASDALSYFWTVPFDWTINSGQGTSSLNVTIGSVSGDICASPSNNCGGGIQACQTVTVSQTPGAATIAGTTSHCQGAITNFTTNVYNATSYSWNIPSGWTINSGQGTSSIEVTIDSSSGDVCVTPINNCGSGQSACQLVTVIPAPGMASISGNPTPSDQTNETYNVNANNATAYDWTVPPGWIINSGQGTATINVIVNNSSGNICAIPTNSCGSGMQGCLTTNVITGINNIDEKNALKIYPNPATNQFTIEFSLEQRSNVSIRLFDELSKLIKTLIEQPMSGNQKLFFEMSQLNRGYYFLEVRIGSCVSNSRLVIIN